MTPLTPQQLDDLERLQAEATPRPWKVRRGQWGRGSQQYRYVAFSGARNESYTTSPLEAADARVIVAAVNALPALLVAARREARLAAVVAELRRVYDNDEGAAEVFEAVRAAIATPEATE